MPESVRAGDRIPVGRRKQIAGGVQETREWVGQRMFHAVVVVTDATKIYSSPRLDGIRSFTLQAHHLNSTAGTNRVYFGDSAITAGGAGTKPGVSLVAGSTFGPVAMADTSKLFVAGDFNGDKLILTGVG
mgnify:FL=1